MGVITWIVIAVIILAIMGLGWQTFFAGVKKGADKVGLTSIMKNITDQAKQSFGGVVKNLSNPVSNTVFNATQNATKSVSGSFSNKTT
ncbi:MAG TPA: hypothetical protein VEP90_18665 [Methylomirabilota bacterium]|nr:hypothetical protein [Methylomirabilota bacterium]